MFFNVDSSLAVEHISSSVGDTVSDTILCQKRSPRVVMMTRHSNGMLYTTILMKVQTLAFSHKSPLTFPFTSAGISLNRVPRSNKGNGISHNEKIMGLQRN